MDLLLKYAPLLASVIATVAILSGLWQFRTTQRLTREAKAVDLFLKFNELTEKLPTTQGTRPPQSSFWQYNALLTITQAIFALTRGIHSWDSTIEWMLQTQNWFLTQNSINCQSFSPEFVIRMKKAVPQIRCTE
jgi:hypothetical protein